jgi:hypothetical protein
MALCLSSKRKKKDYQLNKQRSADLSFVSTTDLDEEDEDD